MSIGRPRARINVILSLEEAFFFFILRVIGIYIYRDVRARVLIVRARKMERRLSCADYKSLKKTERKKK